MIPSAWRGRPDRAALAALVLFAIVLLAVLKLASEIGEGETTALDTVILRAMRETTGGDTVVLDVFRQLMLDATALGDPTTLILMVTAAAGWCLARRAYREAAFLVGATVAGGSLTALLKHLVARPRPDVVAHLVEVHSASFPSGHAAASAKIYLTLATLAAAARVRRAEKAFLIGAAILLVLLIGVSRAYLGVHWPTDIIAGWAIGGSWALAAGLVRSWLMG